MHQVVTRIVNWLVGEKIISEEERDIYTFGLRQGIIYLINIATFVVIGLLARTLWGVIIFIGIYMFVRRYAGGYHVVSEVGCYLSSTVIITFVAWMLGSYQFNYQILIGVALIVTLIMIQLGPVEDAHKPLDSIEVQVYGHRLKVSLLLEWCLIVTAWVFHYNYIVTAATLGLIAAGVVVLLGWFQSWTGGLRSD